MAILTFELHNVTRQNKQAGKAKSHILLQKTVICDKTAAIRKKTAAGELVTQ